MKRRNIFNDLNYIFSLEKNKCKSMYFVCTHDTTQNKETFPKKYRSVGWYCIFYEDDKMCEEYVGAAVKMTHLMGG